MKKKQVFEAIQDVALKMSEDSLTVETDGGEIDLTEHMHFAAAVLSWPAALLLGKSDMVEYEDVMRAAVRLYLDEKAAEDAGAAKDEIIAILEDLLEALR
jgi:hypothetical protein